MAFQDHFSERAPAYAASRPVYPRSLFETLASLAPRRSLAWDCGAGNGQASIGLAEFFDHVCATDPSRQQIKQGIVHPRVTYSCSAESAPSLGDASVDLVIAAQAAHWFNRALFYNEVKRVLRKGGIIAIWCYELCHIEPAIDRVIERFYSETVGPFWPPERRHVDNGYRDFEFPFAEMPFPNVLMEHEWQLGEFVGYLRTWSAVMRFEHERGFDPIPTLAEQLQPLWGPGIRLVRWPILGRLGRA